MEARSIAKYVRVSPRKAGQVCSLVRGKNVDEALAILKFTPRGAADIIAKVVKSAKANAENNHEMDADKLYIASIVANQGPTIKRFMPRAQGRATMIRKRTSHIEVVLKERLYVAGVAKIEIERSANKIRIDLHVAKPGVVIGAAGAKIEALKAELEKMTKKTVIVNIIEVKGIDRNAQLVAENIALAIERRVAFRRAMKQAVQRALKSGAKGIKVAASGRLGGAEMARTEGYSEGNVPLQTLRSDIDYGFAEADTTYGKIGIKVWICNGEVLPTRNGVNPREERKDNRRDRRDNKRRDNRRDNNRRNSRGNDRARGQRPQRSEKNN